MFAVLYCRDIRALFFFRGNVTYAIITYSVDQYSRPLIFALHVKYREKKGNTVIKTHNAFRHSSALFKCTLLYFSRTFNFPKFLM